MKIKILGKTYSLVFSRSMPEDDYGSCDDPNTKRKRIRISKGLDEEKELDTLIHEMLHAAGWQLLSEEWVFAAARDIARVLRRLGWRRA